MTALTTQAMKFTLVGVINTAVGLGCIWALMLVGIPALQANAIGYGLGIIVSFKLNRNWTFRPSPDTLKTGSPLVDKARFLASFALAWGMNFLVVWAGLHFTDVSPYMLQLVGMAIYSTIFLMICRTWVFADKK